MSTGLTKENFWNEMQSKYPEAMKKFCDWIDEYKKRVNWNVIFNDGIRAYKYVKGPDKFTAAPKFHDLPLAMQMGIWIEFISKKEYDMKECMEEVSDYFKLQEIINENA